MGRNYEGNMHVIEEDMTCPPYPDFFLSIVAAVKLTCIYELDIVLLCKIIRCILMC